MSKDNWRSALADRRTRVTGSSATGAEVWKTFEVVLGLGKEHRGGLYAVKNHRGRVIYFGQSALKPASSRNRGLAGLYTAVSAKGRRPSADEVVRAVITNAVVEAADGAMRLAEREHGPKPLLVMLGTVSRVEDGMATIHASDPQMPGDLLEIVVRLADIAEPHRDWAAREGAVVDLALHDDGEGGRRLTVTAATRASTVRSPEAVSGASPS